MVSANAICYYYSINWDGAACNPSLCPPQYHKITTTKDNLDLHKRLPEAKEGIVHANLS